MSSPVASIRRGSCRRLELVEADAVDSADGLGRSDRGGLARSIEQGQHGNAWKRSKKWVSISPSRPGVPSWSPRDARNLTRHPCGVSTRVTRRRCGASALKVLSHRPKIVEPSSSSGTAPDVLVTCRAPCTKRAWNVRIDRLLRDARDRRAHRQEQVAIRQHRGGNGTAVAACSKPLVQPVTAAAGYC